MAQSMHCVQERLRSRCISQSRSGLQQHRSAIPRKSVILRASRDDFRDEHGRSDEFLNAALREAVTIFVQAQAQSKEQLKQELQESLLSTASWSDNPATESNQQAFWIEQGLRAKQADKLAVEVCRKYPNLSLDQLALRLKRLRRILPDASAADLVARDSAMLDVDVNVAVSNLVLLVQAMPSRNVSEMVMKEPRLLYCEDLETRLDTIVNKLTEIHPSKDKAIAVDIIQENPQLLYRMPYHMHATMLDELPIEIQNMMLIVDDKGIGFLYKYYKERGQFTK